MIRTKKGKQGRIGGFVSFVVSCEQREKEKNRRKGKKEYLLFAFEKEITVGGKINEEKVDESERRGEMEECVTWKE